MQQGCMLLHSTDGDIQATFAGSKKGDYFFEVAKFLDLDFAGKLIKIYQDGKTFINPRQNGTISNRAKRIEVPLVKACVELNPTALQHANLGTKPQPFKECWNEPFPNCQLDGLQQWPHIRDAATSAFD